MLSVQTGGRGDGVPRMPLLGGNEDKFVTDYLYRVVVVVNA